MRECSSRSFSKAGAKTTRVRFAGKGRGRCEDSLEAVSAGGIGDGLAGRPVVTDQLLHCGAESFQHVGVRKIQDSEILEPGATHPTTNLKRG